MNIVLKNVKINQALSEETNCFSATIYLDGGRVGTVANRGCGGGNEYHWSDKDAGERLHEYAKSLPPLDELSMDLDLLIDDILRKQDIESQYKKWCKKDVMYRLKGDKEGVWRSARPRGGPPWTPAMKNHLITKYGDKIETILNQQLYGDPV